MRFAILLLAICAVIGGTNSRKCKGNKFLCEESGICIPRNRRCDGVADCAGGTDELNCSSTTTATTTTTTTKPCPWFACADSGVCIPENWDCDGIVDCADGSDEKNCPPTTTTTTECPGFVCHDSGKCIYGSWVCDTWPDCEDNSDEQGCATASTTPETVKAHKVPSLMVAAGIKEKRLEGKRRFGKSKI